MVLMRLPRTSEALSRALFTDVARTSLAVLHKEALLGLQKRTGMSSGLGVSLSSLFWKTMRTNDERQVEFIIMDLCLKVGT